MKHVGGMVNAQGQSALPQGVHDMTGLPLDDQLEQRLHDMLKDVDELDKLKAKFKLEVVFTDHRSMHKPFPGFIMAWTNGGFDHGGGDEVVYLCPAKTDHGQCNTPLHIAFVSRRVAVCPSCKNAYNPKDLIGQVYAKLTMQGWATLITKMFRVLECNANIRMGVLKGDLHKTTSQEMEHSHHGEKINTVRRSRSWISYPLKNIVKDTSSGSDLESRIGMFLKA